MSVETFQNQISGLLAHLNYGVYEQFQSLGLRLAKPHGPLSSRATGGASRQRHWQMEARTGHTALRNINTSMRNAWFCSAQSSCIQQHSSASVPTLSCMLHRGCPPHPGRPMRTPEIKFRVRGSRLLTESFGHFIMGKSGVILSFMLAPVGFTNMTVEILSGD